MKARSIMIQGTASDVGKSLICTALCRVFANKGYRVIPFKSQNMALNSYVTLDGGEIGRSQGVQAEAARIVATTDMNPILLKPKQNMVSEVIVNGKHFLDMNAMSYRNSFVQEAMPIIRKSVEKLQQEYDIIVLEGAGSPAEINLKDRDIANMRMAKLADSAVILVADIDRGGVFASIIGTLALLDDDERDRVKGIIINKFRGIRELLDDGIKWLQQETGIPVLGVLPYLDVSIEAEDSLALSSLRFKNPKKDEFPIDVAVLKFPHISNFTDVDPFFDEPGVGVRLVGNILELGRPDLLILPGTKNTIEDLKWMKGAGFDGAIKELRKHGTIIVGICGGFQMLGTNLFDPDAVEDCGEDAEGLSLLSLETIFQAEKKTVQMEGVLAPGFLKGEMKLVGYEIHLGQTALDPQVQAFLLLKDGREDGAISADKKVFGTYLHGIFHNRLFTRELVNLIRRSKGLDEVMENIQSDSERREEAYNLLAFHLEENIDMDTIYQLLELEAVDG
ncbi:cobyric acid synthase [Peribacillus muralis]|uniref:cobyric acid synthase n=1 Tax=Peribacillus muralis TaxID=264697 RepID=UPI003D027B3E